MGITQAVTTVFKSKDQTSQNFKKMGKNAKKFGEDSSRAFKKASKSATSFGTITKGILAAGLVQKALGGVTRGLSAVAVEFVNFDDSITAASAKFQGLDLSTKAGQKTLLQLKKSARETGAETKFSASEAAAGLDFYATAGFNAAQAMKVLKPTAKLATIANLDLARTSDIASDSIGAFGLMTKDSAQLQKNFTRVSDVMAKTMTSTNTGMEDMFESIKKGGAAFTGAGQEMETFQALIGKMANAGLKGAESGTQLRNIILRLAKPTGEAGELIEKMGIKTADSEGNFRNVIDILGDFEKATSKMGDVQKAGTLKTIFGTRSVTGLSVILKEGTKSIKAFEKELKNAGGSTKKMADIMDKSLGNRLKGLKSAAIEVGFQLFTAFEKQGGGAIDKLTKMVRNVDLGPLIQSLKIALFVTEKLAKAIGVVSDAISSIPRLIPGLSEFIDIKPEVLEERKKMMIGRATALHRAKTDKEKLALTLKFAAIDKKAFDDKIAAEKKLDGITQKTEEKKERTGPRDFISQGFLNAVGSIEAGGRLFDKLTGSEPEEQQRQAPNKTKLEGQQNVNFAGKMTFENAPEGAKFESSTTGGQVEASGLGAN